MFSVGKERACIFAKKIAACRPFFKSAQKKAPVATKSTLVKINMVKR